MRNAGLQQTTLLQRLRTPRRISSSRTGKLNIESMKLNGIKKHNLGGQLCSRQAMDEKLLLNKQTEQRLNVLQDKIN